MYKAKVVTFFSHVAFILHLLIILGTSADKLSQESIKEQISNTGLLADGHEELLFVSTLDGALHAVIKSTGIKKWTLKDDPVIQNPSSSEEPPVPRFFPNPQDGSLYRYTAGRGREPLKKLPFTIPELVANSPCRSNDGIFYVGKKVDTWVGVDSISGKKQLILGSEGVEVCPKPSRNTIYFGRTHYNIVLFELNTGHKWNVSFYHYATNSASAVKNYDLVHYSATGEGEILTVDQKTGSPLWNLVLDSPVVALYTLDADSTLSSIPLTTVTPQTLQRFSYNFKELYQSEFDENSGDILIKELSPTIYLGETASGVYALPAFVDTNTARISRRHSQLLLAGPPGQKATIGKVENTEEHREGPDVLLLGYYDLPESLKTDLKKVSSQDIGVLTNAGLPLGITHQINYSAPHPDVESSQDQSQHIFWYGIHQLVHLNVTFLLSEDVVRWTFNLSQRSLSWVLSDPLNFMVAILSAGLAVIIGLLYRQAQDYARLSREVSSRRNHSSQGSSGLGSSGSDITAVAEELEDGVIRVGKISFDPQKLLGKGCDGTFVFKGTFDGRSVAVKRVLPSCFSIADREVDLLRESDQHPNVIRYFCMEQCREFRYIALELCLATLEDLVHMRADVQISPITLLRQATAGLYHLHCLDIVHRDVKPHNVLISLPSSRGEVRAMISDFGLCKRLEVGRMSFSRRSGVTGTDGWIAPEMMTTGRSTSKVDIFSLGCVFYYVLSKGKHPFGSILNRQSNIISSHYSLDDLDKNNDVMSRSLVEKMICADPSDRPPTQAILRHPLFWSPDKILQFFQDVSDRVEKETCNSLVVMNLEWCGSEVVREDWTRHMHPIIGEDLRRFREYKGRSVRDLLRALRNKKNHYRELSEDARQIFGRIPEDFVPYWTLRFPRLLLHSWYALQCCKLEPIFARYYPPGFRYKPSFDQDSFGDPTHAMISLAPNNRPSNAPNSVEAETMLKTPANPDPFILFDKALGASHLRKGPRRPPKLEKETDSVPWILRKPRNTFEPRFKTRPQDKEPEVDPEELNGCDWQNSVHQKS